MKVQVESISPVKKRLSVEVPAEQVSRGEEKAFQELRRSVKLPGFRPGKVPLNTVKRLYAGRVRSDTIGRLIEETYTTALQQQTLVPVADPDIELQEADEDGGFSYTAVVEVRPSVEPRGYQELTCRRERVVVDETAVEERLEALRAQHATYEPAPAEHGAADGDMVVIDFVGRIDGEAFAGGSGEDRSLVLGSGQFIPGFEEGLLGATAGETRTVEVAFPEDYRAEHLAGRTAAFEVTVKELKQQVLPEIDDEWAKEVADLDSAQALRQQVRDALEQEQRNRVESEFRQRVIDQLLEANPFEVPEAIVSRQQRFSDERLRADLTQRGIDPDAVGLNEPRIQEGQRRGAERAVRWAFLLRAIADAEEVAVTDADVDQRLTEIAAADGRPVSAIRAFFEEDDRLEGLRSGMLERKVLDTVLESATVEEVAADELQPEDAQR